jgi:hypothetical protein
MTKEKGGRYACEENEGEGKAKSRQGAVAVLTSRLRSDNGTAQEDREKEEVAAAV